LLLVVVVVVVVIIVLIVAVVAAKAEATVVLVFDIIVSLFYLTNILCHFPIFPCNIGLVFTQTVIFSSLCIIAFPSFCKISICTKQCTELSFHDRN
jgi:hypothetical protein